MSYVFGLFFQVKLFTFDILLTSWSRDFHRALMVRYFDLNLCDKSTSPVITISRNMLCPLSNIAVHFSINHDRTGGRRWEKGISPNPGRTKSHVYFIFLFFLNLISFVHCMSNITCSDILYSNAACLLKFFFRVSTSNIINAHLLIFIKGEACSFTLPPAFIRQRVIVVCPITALK